MSQTITGHVRHLALLSRKDVDVAATERIRVGRTRAWVVARAGDEEILVARPDRVARRPRGSVAPPGGWLTVAAHTAEVAGEIAALHAGKVAAARASSEACAELAAQYLPGAGPLRAADLASTGAAMPWLVAACAVRDTPWGPLGPPPSTRPDLMAALRALRATVGAGKRGGRVRPTREQARSFAARHRLPRTYLRYLARRGHRRIGPLMPLEQLEPLNQARAAQPGWTPAWFVIGESDEGRVVLDRSRAAGPIFLVSPALDEVRQLAPTFYDYLLLLAAEHHGEPIALRPDIQAPPWQAPGWRCVATGPRAALYLDDSTGRARVTSREGTDFDQAMLREWTDARNLVADLALDPPSRRPAEIIRAMPAPTPSRVDAGAIIAGVLFGAVICALLGLLLVLIGSLVTTLLIALGVPLPHVPGGMTTMWLATSALLGVIIAFMFGLSEGKEPP